MHTEVPVRVLHFVTGGFSGGATQVAVALVNAARQSPRMEPLLVLRKKWHTDNERIRELEAAGVPVVVIPGWSKLATIWALVRVCRQFRPDVLMAHGFSEHLWGRYAGLIAKVPHMIHVEHNTRERYTAWRRAQSRWLSRYTDRIVGCSEGVRNALLAMGLPAEKTLAISNGINLAPFAHALENDYRQRVPGIVMVSRFSRQKDHATLIEALALLAENRIRPVLKLAGGGKSIYRRPLEQLAQRLGVSEQVEFLGVCRNVPELLMTHQLAVLSTHYEGMPLVLLEGMAAGCVVIGSDVPGVREVIENGVDGYLVPESDPLALADCIERCLADTEQSALVARAGHRKAATRFSREAMHAAYEALVLELAR